MPDERITPAPLSARLRYEVLRRDNYVCRYCGATAPDAKLQVDHVVPTALGGQNEPSNLVTSCANCNAGKGSSSPDEPLVEGVSDTALRWANAMRRAAEVQSRDRDAKRTYSDEFERMWGGYYSLPNDWRVTIEHWFDLGIEIELLRDCIDKAFGAYNVDWRWKYFCGIVWKRIGERQQIARELIENEEREAE